MPQISDATIHAWERHLGKPVDPSALRRALTDGSLPSAFHAAAGAAAGRPALTIGTRTVTHDELDALVGKAAAWLHELGVRPGETVVIAVETSIEVVAAYLGALRAGATVVLAGSASAEPELRQIVEDSGAVALLGSGSALDVLEPLVRDVAVAADVARAADHPGAAPQETPSSDAPAILAYTSGTTGRPKRVRLTHANLLASIRAAMWAWRWSPDDVLVHALPLSHQHGLGGLHAALLSGAHLIAHPRFDPAELMGEVARSRATVLFAVPAMYQRLVESGAAAAADATSLRLAVCGSAPLSAELATAVRDALGLIPLERYGTTESGLDVSNPIDGPRPGTVGLPLPGLELEIVDADGVPVEPGADGEIVLRGPQVFAGYGGAAGDEFHDGGWFRTGDVGRLATDGYLQITGRLKELIISGGFNVYPREVELALEQDPDVAQAAVVGVPSERWGEEVVAFVVPRDGVTVDPAGIVARCRERIAVYKCPKQVHPIGELPRNAMGKLQRQPLVDRAYAARRHHEGALRALDRLESADAGT